MIIFLDIDGVMVPIKSWKSPELLHDGFPAFSNKATNVLECLIDDNTTIILTTSHKGNYTIEEWKNIFEKRGIKINNLKRLDNNILNLSRKEEILLWFNTFNTNDDFVIIDDDKSLNDLPNFLKQNLVLTSPIIGLTDEHLFELGKILHKNLASVK